MSDFRGVLVRVRGGRASTIGGGMVDLEPGGSDGQRLGHPGWPQYFTGARTASTRDEGDCDTPARTMPGCSRFCPANPVSTRGCANFRARCRPARAPGLAHGASDTGLRSDDVWVAVSWSTSLSRAFDLAGRHVEAHRPRRRRTAVFTPAMRRPPPTTDTRRTDPARSGSATQTRAGPPMPRLSPCVPDGIYISRTFLRCDAWDWSAYYLLCKPVWEMVAGRHEAQPTVVGSSLSLPAPQVARAMWHSH